MDRNQLMGAMFISLVLVVYMQYFLPKNKTRSSKEVSKDNTIDESKFALKQETIDEFKKHKFTNIEKQYLLDAANTNKPKSVKRLKDNVKDLNYTLENKHIKYNFSNIGGNISEVSLKKYKTESQYVKLIQKSKSNSKMALNLNLEGLDININTLKYELESYKGNKISFILKLGKDKYIKKKYELVNNYELNQTIEIFGLKEGIQGNNMTLIWLNKLIPQEKDLESSKNKTTINYFTDRDKFSSLSIKKDKDVEKKLNNMKLHWIGLKQKFFVSALISPDKNIQNAHLFVKYNQKDKNIVKTTYTKIDIPFKKGIDGTYNFTFYFGPVKYNELKKVAPGFSNNLSLGWPVIKKINQYFTIPLFNLLHKYIRNCGILIIILVLIIKLLLFPLSFKSHIANAKIKSLNPKLEEIKKKFKDDKQKQQMAQINLYKTMGVNPLSGCIPILLQMPILLSMFNFFPNIIELRQESFLWSQDLSMYDSIFSLPFTIPLYGDHISLFALLMTITTIFSTLGNNQLSSGNSDSSMKMLTYAMPLMFMVIFNSHASGLTLYYLISGLFGIIQQLITNRLVDTKSIALKLEENQLKNTPQNPKISRALSRLENKKNKKK